MLSKSVFVVTGGSRGIGAAIVESAAAAGNNVAFTFNNNKAAADNVLAKVSGLKNDVNCRAYQLNVRNPSEVDAFSEKVLKDFGSVQVVVPNAGINKNGPVMSMSDEDWQDVISTNLDGAFYLARAFLPSFLEQRFGRFIFISSLSRDGLSGQANYATSKSGLIGLSRTLAKEYGKRGITSNVVAPGVIDTDMSRDNMSSSTVNFWQTHSPLHRVGTSQEVASAVMFFSQEESRYINGTCLPVTSSLDWVP